MKRTKVNLQKEITNALLILVGIFSAAFGLKGFLIPNHFIDGGVTGISLLVSSTTKTQTTNFPKTRNILI